MIVVTRLSEIIESESSSRIVAAPSATARNSMAGLSRGRPPRQTSGRNRIAAPRARMAASSTEGSPASSLTKALLPTPAPTAARASSIDRLSLGWVTRRYARLRFHADVRGACGFRRGSNEDLHEAAGPSDIRICRPPGAEASPVMPVEGAPWDMVAR